MITLDQNAPSWAHDMLRQINAAFLAAPTPLPVFTVATVPSATDKNWLWRPIAISDGAGNKFVAISNGTAWRYLEGTAV